jgi:predicted alpha/beta hydrolase
VQSLEEGVVMVEQEQPARRETISFSDGSSTTISVFPANDPSAPVVLCLPAMGVRANYYEILGDTLVDLGFNVALADLRGAGDSSVRASRRVSFGYAEMLQLELPAIVDYVCAQFGTAQLIILGHSLGGQIGLLFAAASSRVSHVVLVASGSAWYRRVPGFRAVGRFFGLQLMFAVTLLWGYLPRWFPFAGQEARRVMLDWGIESMTGRYRISRSSVHYEKALAQSTVPALFVVLPDDPYVPRPCSAHLAGKLRSTAVAWREIGPERFGLTKTHHFRWVLRPQAVADAVSEWTGLPSRVAASGDAPTGVSNRRSRPAAAAAPEEDGGNR